MKKLFVLCLSLVLVAAMSTTMLATGAFVSSPSGNPAPELVAGTNSSEDCESELVITAYGDRADLSEEARQAMEAVYATIVGTEDLGTLNSGLAALAQSKGTTTANLAVSDLFDISATDCGDHEGHGHFDITLKAESLANFVCLLHYHDGAWHIVEGATVTNNGEHLEFDEDEFSPFAIVVSTGAANNDHTGSVFGSGSIIAIVTILVLVAGGAVAAYFFYNKKKKA